MPVDLRAGGGGGREDGFLGAGIAGFILETAAARRELRAERRHDRAQAAGRLGADCSSASSSSSSSSIGVGQAATRGVTALQRTAPSPGRAAQARRARPRRSGSRFPTSGRRSGQVGSRLRRFAVTAAKATGSADGFDVEANAGRDREAIGLGGARRDAHRLQRNGVARSPGEAPETWRHHWLLRRRLRTSPRCGRSGDGRGLRLAAEPRRLRSSTSPISAAIRSPMGSLCSRLFAWDAGARPRRADCGQSRNRSRSHWPAATTGGAAAGACGAAAAATARDGERRALGEGAVLADRLEIGGNADRRRARAAGAARPARRGSPDSGPRGARSASTAAPT